MTQYNYNPSLISYLGYNDQMLFKIAQLCFDEEWNKMIVEYPRTLIEQELDKLYCKFNAVRKQELILDLHCCLDADL